MHTKLHMIFVTSLVQNPNNLCVQVVTLVAKLLRPDAVVVYAENKYMGQVVIIFFPEREFHSRCEYMCCVAIDKGVREGKTVSMEKQVKPSLVIRLLIVI